MKYKKNRKIKIKEIKSNNNEVNLHGINTRSPQLSNPSLFQAWGGKTFRKSPQNEGIILVEKRNIDKSKISSFCK